MRRHFSNCSIQHSVAALSFCRYAKKLSFVVISCCCWAHLCPVLMLDYAHDTAIICVWYETRERRDGISCWRSTQLARMNVLCEVLECKSIWRRFSNRFAKLLSIIKCASSSSFSHVCEIDEEQHIIPKILETAKTRTFSMTLALSGLMTLPLHFFLCRQIRPNVHRLFFSKRTKAKKKKKKISS